jgi:transposase, IS30 family
LHRSHSSILDEIERNKVNGRYDPIKADHKAYAGRKEAKYQGMRIVQNPKLQDFVEEHLYDDQSPQAIAGRIQRYEKKLPNVSKDSIYRYIQSPYGRRIEYHRKKRNTKRRRHKPRTKPWKDRVFIEKRPLYINARRRVGDAEGDFIVSGKSGQGILFVVEDRKVRVTFLEQILKPNCAAILRACKRIKKRYPEWNSMTTDNDILFQHHKELERELGIKIYFCHPYHAWEKGMVENTNKCIRKDIPKSSNVSRYSKRFIQKLETKLNRRIMDVLNYRTPQELLDRHRKRKKRLRAL